MPSKAQLNRRRARNKQLNKPNKHLIEESNKEYIENKISDIIFKYGIKNKWVNNCIPISIILSESFNKKSIENVIKKGLLHMETEGNKKALFHCWVETDGKIYDLSNKLMIKLNPSWNKFSENTNFTYSETLLDGYDRIDMDNDIEIITLNNNNILYDRYVENSEDFWNLTPGIIKKYRNDIFRMVDNL
tara:strand:- start:3163 stop:3729 length:567 start_codon:yes stop_codon:yes gene_type:complete